MSTENNDTQQLGQVTAVLDTANAVRAAGTAADCHDAVMDAEIAGEELRNLRDIAETVNSMEAWNPASLSLFGNHLDSLCKRLGLEGLVNIPTIKDLQSAQDPAKFQVSLEDVNKIIDSIQSSSAEIQERSTAALVELVDALGVAVPKLQSRLKEVVDRANSLDEGCGGGNVTLSDPTSVKRLLVDGKIPKPFADFVNVYANYGEKLLGEYTEASFQAVMRIDTFTDNVDYGSFNGFWDSISDKIKEIGDPRSTLTDAQMTMRLPGAGPLFSGDVDVDDKGILVREKLERFVRSHRPVSLSDFSIEVVGDEAGPVEGLTVAEIRDSAKYLSDLIDQIDVKAVSDSCKAAWIDSSRVIAQVKGTLQGADESVLKALDDDQNLLPAYLECLFILSAWPVLNYLTNLTLFVNAFGDYAISSMDPACVASSSDESTEVTETASGDVVEGEQVTAEETAAVETEQKQTDPDNPPDTGMTPDEPVDATGDGERAVVDIDATSEETGEDTPASEEGEGELIDLSADAAAADEDKLDVSASDGGEEEEEEEEEEE